MVLETGEVSGSYCQAVALSIYTLERGVVSPEKRAGVDAGCVFAASAKTPDSNNHEHNGFIGWTLGYSTSLQPHQPFLGKVRHPCIGAYCRVLEGDRTDSETGSVTDSVTGCGRGDGRGFIKNVLLERMQSAEVGGAFQSTGFLQYSTAGQGGGWGGVGD